MDDNESSNLFEGNGNNKNKNEDNEEVIEYKHPAQTVRDEQLMKINQVFKDEIAMLDQKIAMAKYKKNQIILQIEEKKKALFLE